MVTVFDRSVKPEPKKELRFGLPEIKEFFLTNGLRVLFVRKNNLPIFQATMLIDAGSRFDAADKAGTAYLTSALIDEGAGSWDALELSDEFERIGAIFISSSNNDASYLSMLTLTENFERGLELFSAILIEPKLAQKDFEREKKKQIAQILQSMAKPSYLANLIFEKNIFNESPYSQPSLGYEQTVAGIEHGDILSFYEKYYRVEGSTLVVVANIEETNLIETLEKHLGKWQNRSGISFQEKKFFPPKGKIFLFDKSNAPQSEILLGHLTDRKNSPDYFAKLIFNSVFGGQFSSRLNSNLRENKGYTYGVNSSFLYNKTGGYFNISTSVEAKNTIPAIKEIIYEAQKVKAGISEDEIKFARAYLSKRLPSLFETYGLTAHNLSSLVLFDLPLDYYDHYIDNINKVTTEQVDKVAQEKLRIEDFILVLVGDGKTLEKELTGMEPFNSVELVTFPGQEIKGAE